MANAGPRPFDAHESGANVSASDRARRRGVRPQSVDLRRIFAAICAVAGVYAARHVAIDADTAKLISANAPWRQRGLELDRAFPQRDNLIAIVIDGATPELAESAAASLAARLATDTKNFRAVWRPDGGAFFDREGLLFGSTSDVSRTLQQLIAAQPLLGVLAADPTLRV
jgi:hypothetical protein